MTSTSPVSTILRRTSASHEGRAQVRAGRELEQLAVARLQRQLQCAAFEEIAFNQRPFRHLAGNLVSLNLPDRVVIPIRRVTQEDHAQHGMQYSLLVSLELARRLSAAAQRSVSSCSMLFTGTSTPAPAIAAAHRRL
jgi:hypothetical protein